MLGFSSFFICFSSTSYLSDTAFNTAVMSALFILSQMRLTAAQYFVANALYVLSLSSWMTENMESSKVEMALSILSRKFDVAVGCFAAAETALPDPVAWGVIFVLAMPLDECQQATKFSVKMLL